ncbi:MAG TPA: AAA family ATPase, partial [Acidimicrobiales bacterium]|nr:AAA family ATPase [Acidimicrobiales bacterium]
MIVGRAAELQALRAAIAAHRSVAVVGEAGIGKTALIREAVAGDGGAWLEGGSLATLSWLPYLPIMRALRRPLPEGDHAAVADFVIGHVGARILVIEDLHWADNDTNAIVPLLAHQVVLVVSVRSDEQYSAKASSLVRGSGMESVSLTGLPDGQSSDLVRLRCPELHTQTVRSIVRRSGGNPLLLEEQAATGGSSATLGRALGERLRTCRPRAREGLALLSLLGRPTGRGLIGTVADDLMHSGFIVEEAGQIAIRHGLLAEAVLGSIDEPTRIRLHARLARSLPDPGEAARHHAAAGEPRLALELARQAAANASRPGERSRHLALAAACATGDDADELRLEAAAALVEAAEYHEAADLVREMTSDDPQLLARSHLQRARALFGLNDPKQARVEIEDGLAAVTGTRSPTEVRLRIEAARLPAEEGLTDHSPIEAAS